MTFHTSGGGRWGSVIGLKEGQSGVGGIFPPDQQIHRTQGAHWYTAPVGLLHPCHYGWEPPLYLSLHHVLTLQGWSALYFLLSPRPLALYLLSYTPLSVLLLLLFVFFFILPHHY